MDCAQVSDSLPWLLNGTLDAATRQAVEAHVAQCPRCRQTRDDTSFTAQAFGQHVPTDALVDYAFGRPVEGIGTVGLDAHLTACEPCRDQLALIRESRDRLTAQTEPRHTWSRVVDWPNRSRLAPLALAAGLVLATTVGGWIWARQQAESLQARLADEQRRAGERVAGLETALKGAQDETRRLGDASATLRREQEQARGERVRLESQLAALRVPQPNAPILELLPENLTERAGARVNEVVLPSNALSVTLILAGQARSSAPRYGIELTDQNRRVIWSARGLPRQARGEYTLSIPTAFLQAGPYTISVYGDEANPRATTETYRLSVKGGGK